MSNSTQEPDSPTPAEPGGIGITDDMLPEDLQPTDDNPLAQAPDTGGRDGGGGLPDSGGDASRAGSGAADLPDMGTPGP
jgi:hypothetical protein